MKYTPTVGEILQAKGRIAARISQILCDDCLIAGAATQHDPTYRRGNRECQATVGHLAVVPGVHRMH